jgi:hypothetical protein
MDSLEHSRRQSQNLISKTGTLSWIWCANEQIEYKGFKVYSQLIIPGTNDLAVCMECFNTFSQNLGVSTGSWETKVGPAGNNSSHLKSHLQRHHIEIYNRADAHNRNLSVNFNEPEFAYMLMFSLLN